MRKEKKIIPLIKREKGYDCRVGGVRVSGVVMNRRSLFITDHSHHPHHHDRLLGCSAAAAAADYKNPHLLLHNPEDSHNGEEDDHAAAGLGEEMAPLHKQQSTDNQTDSEQTMTSHLSLPHFALHRQV